MVPVAEFDRLLDQLEAQELTAMLDDPSVRWVPAGKAALGLASLSIAEARRKAGLTQRQLAQRLGMQQSQVSRIEKHPDRTTIRTMQRVAAALGVDVGTLLRFAARPSRSRKKQ